MQAFLDNWQDEVYSHQEITISDDSEIPTLVSKLNGETHTLISFVIALEGRFLQVAGGPEYFVVTGKESDTSYNLTDPNSDSEERVAIVAGGQEGLFEHKYAITKHEATKAALAYFHAAAIPTEDPRFTWEILEPQSGDMEEFEDATN
ncbi:Imm1 family immunity protein [Corynebacterium freiburgense]|uniref:Imm1 family immunity protein n=1 Tax=Corynebacterium freiburgense TaxID=556548 RepID=UPI0004002E7D|nr:Imm1 family immunity protein [Corynebacterium freiburgense]WJZ02653.1 hypothetical protein CFREI_06835 [Corynebacterium freiburgense]